MKYQKDRLHLKWYSPRLRWTWTCLAWMLLGSSIFFAGCAKVGEMATDLFRPERIVPVFDPDATITPQTGTVIYKRNGIVAMMVPLPNVQNVDAFGVLIHNSTDHWISYIEADCQMLDPSGNIVRPLDRSQRSFHLKKNYKPKLPPEFAADVFRYDKTIRVYGGPAVLPTEDLKKTNIMPKNRSLFYLYFPKRSVKSNKLRIIIPGVQSEFKGQQTTFVFKFKVQRG